MAIKEAIHILPTKNEYVRNNNLSNLTTMNENRHFAYRFRILDRCFSDFSRKYSKDELRTIVNDKLREQYGPNAEIEERQFKKDLQSIRDMLPKDVELNAYRFNGKQFYYRYSKRNYSYYNNELTVSEISRLSSAIDMLSRFRGLPNYTWLEDTITKLELKFGINGKGENLVSFDQNLQLEGLQNLSMLISATFNKQVLDIVYTKYDGSQNLHTLHPYFMKQYNGRWFLFGLDEREMRIKNLPIDRISQINSSDKCFIKNENIDFNTYFDDIVGVSLEENKDFIDLVLKFSPNRFRYVTSKPIHKSQKVVSEEEKIVSLHLIPTRELEQQLFSFGPDIEILSPSTYREEFAKKIAENVKKYFPGH